MGSEGALVLVCFVCVGGAGGMSAQLSSVHQHCFFALSSQMETCRFLALWSLSFYYLHFEWDRWIGKTCPCYRSWLGSKWEEGALFSAQPLRALYSVESVLPWLLPSLRAKWKALEVQRAGIDVQSGNAPVSNVPPDSRRVN